MSLCLYMPQYLVVCTEYRKQSNLLWELKEKLKELIKQVDR